MVKQGFLISLTIAGLLAVSPARGLVIYRFGGQDLPAPVEEGSPGVEVVRLDWTDLDPDSGGQAMELALFEDTIGSLKRDPTFNIAPTIAAEGGSHLRPSKNGAVWDGDTSTVWVASRYLCAEFAPGAWFRCIENFGTPGTANLDLGHLFQIDRVRVISGLRDPSRIVQSFAVHLSATLPRGLGGGGPIGPFLPWVAKVRDNRQQVIDVEIPPHDGARYLQVIIGEHNDEWDVHEIEVYARGIVSKSTYVSNILSFDRPVAWGDLRWSGSQGVSLVRIQTRSGTDPTPERYFRNTGRGDEKEVVSQSEYLDASVGERAGVGYDLKHWSFWAPYEFADSSGAPVVSPSPRTHLQVKVDFILKENFIPEEDEGGQLSFLELRASKPVATALVGEVWPVETEVGQLRQFTYVMKPQLQGSDGFDRLEIRSLAMLGSVLEVRRGGDEGDPSQSWDVEVSEDHRLVVSLSPRLGPGDSGATVEVDFEAQVLRFGTTFDALAWDSARPLDVRQRVTPGDATGEYEGNQVSVATSEQVRSLLQVSADPGVLTPNGDGVNDSVTLVYQIMEVTGAASVRVEIWDLSGLRVRLLHDARQGIGRYLLSWDGRDETGRLLPPGIYVYNFTMSTDRDSVNKAGPIHLAY